MKTAFLISFWFISIGSFAQQHSEKLVAEISPINVSLHAGIYLNVQGKISYSFNKYLFLSARHSQEILGGLSSPIETVSKDQYRRNSLSDLNLGITLYNSKMPGIDPTEEPPPPTWIQKALQLDLGMCYFKYANKRSDYFTYEINEQGNYRVINSINRLSASLGFSLIIRENNIKDPANIRLKRQHTISAGAYYGINYDLQGYVIIDGKNVVEKPPKNYSFNRGGYYLRYNFRQQIGKHFFLGTEVSFSKMPYVKYPGNRDIYLLRGGESEPKVQLYAGITLGFAF